MEATLPLVSIVIITYNSANYVTETLESISRQTYCGPIELIVSDDCSQDNTLDICRDWMKHHGSMFVRADIIQTSHNSGICANHNNALKHVRGEWIKYIAGDDMLMPRCIERFVEETRACADCFYISGVFRFGEASGYGIPWETILTTKCRQSRLAISPYMQAEASSPVRHFSSRHSFCAN